MAATGSQPSLSSVPSPSSRLGLEPKNPPRAVSRPKSPRASRPGHAILLTAPIVPEDVKLPLMVDTAQRHSDERRTLLLTASNKSRLPGRAAQGLAAGSNVTSGWSCRGRLMGGQWGVDSEFLGLPVDWQIELSLRSLRKPKGRWRGCVQLSGLQPWELGLCT